MKFLTDQDVYAVTGKFLSGLGHEVVTAAQLGLMCGHPLQETNMCGSTEGEMRNNHQNLKQKPLIQT